MQIIIPTLWKPPGLAAVLAHYLQAAVVERLIVIDNAPASRPADLRTLVHPKLLLLEQSRNLYVNPAWNLGMAQVMDPEAVVAILNDDILVPEAVLTRLQRHPWQPGDVIGLLPDSAVAGRAVPFVLEPFPYRPDCSIGQQARGFGSALVMQKISYTPIPEGLQIWFGDDWLLRQARCVYGFWDASIERHHHLTMEPLRRSPVFRQRLADDRAAARALLGIG